MAALIGVMVLLPEKDFARPSDSTGLVSLSWGTDSQGNSFLVDKLMTTKYPLGVIIVELCHQLARRRAALRAQWVFRLEKEEADALTNSDFRHFRAENRLEVDLVALPFGVLPRLLEQVESYVAELEAVKLGKAAGHDGAAKRRRVKGDALRDRQPWL